MKTIPVKEGGLNKKIRFFIGLALPALFLMAVFLYPAAAEEAGEEETGDNLEELVISEIMFDPAGPNDHSSEWFELYNPTEDIIFLDKDLFGFKEKETSSTSASCHTLGQSAEIQPGDFLIIAENKDRFLDDPLYENILPDLVVDSSFDFSSTKGYLNLSGDRCKTYFLNFSFEGIWGGKDNGKTLEKKDLTTKKYEKDDWQESCVLGGTPGLENSSQDDCEEETAADPESPYKDAVRINEIYPGPDTKGGEEEFVEIVGLDSDEIDISGWLIKDAKGSRPKFSEIYQEGEFGVFFGSFALNSDSNGDTVFLYDENESLVDSFSYSPGKSRLSYAYDGKSWRWTSQKTPGAKNRFDKVLSGQIKKDDKIYVGQYANFSVKTGKEAEKFTWDFGDKHKSYLKETRHRYEKTGTYQASLKITGKGETTVQNFTVKVEKFKAPKIRIKSISPNPKGSDLNEWMVIENESKKKVDLKNWSVATGWDNLYNHPIRTKFEIKPGKEKKLTRAICAFTLNNSQTKIELRDPSGKVVQKIKYDRRSNKIKDDEVYEKSESGWEWVGGVPEESEDAAPAITPLDGSSGISKVAVSRVSLSPEISAYLGKYSPNPDWQKRQAYQIALANFNSDYKIQLAPQEGRVLGAEKVRSDEDHYFFTTPVSEKHWLVNIIGGLVISINSRLNWLLNNFL